MKILLLEDDVILNKSLEQYLESLGHQVHSFLEGNKAYKSVREESYDLMVLDVNVPNINGFEFLKRCVADKKNIPTIFISALLDIEDITTAYELGCFDYLKKPFHLKELNIKINKILQMGVTPSEHIRLSRNYSFHKKTNEIDFQKKLEVFSKRHIQIIEVLARNRGRIVTYEMFRELVWDYNYVDDGVIRAEINRLRKQLKEDFISNIRGVGYTINLPKE